MDPNGKDVLIEEIDKELRAVDTRLKKVGQSPHATVACPLP